MEEIDILEPDIYTDPNADYDERSDGIKGEPSTIRLYNTAFIVDVYYIYLLYVDSV